jgi:hypothetical protein
MFTPCKLHLPFGFETDVLDISSRIPQSCYLPNQYLLKCTCYKVPHYVLLFRLLPLPPCEVQIFSTVPYSQKPSISILLLGGESKFHTHTKIM